MGGAAGWQFVEFFGRDVRHAGSDPLPNGHPPVLKNDPSVLDLGHEVCSRRDTGGLAQFGGQRHATASNDDVFP